MQEQHEAVLLKEKEKHTTLQGYMKDKFAQQHSELDQKWDLYFREHINKQKQSEAAMEKQLNE